jgi:lactoylglutathione lyase
MAKPVHSMIRVLDEAKSLDFYKRAIGLEVVDHLRFSNFALIYLRHPSSSFEFRAGSANLNRPISGVSA